METRKLGKSGERVSVIGFGAWPIGGGMGEIDEREAIATVHAAIDLGITLIDTAQAYRASEAFIGNALRDGRREKVFLATKVSFDYSRSGIRSALEQSLRNLATDHVDLYQLHSFPKEVRVEDSMDELARLQAEGKIRFLGVSNFNSEQMRRALDVARFESSQPRYNLFDRDIERSDIDFCGREGIGILAHSVFAKGLLTGKYQPGHRFARDDERAGMPRFQGATFERYLAAASALAEIANELQLSLVQFAVAWVLRKPEVTCALAGAKSVAQVREQVGAAGKVIPPDFEGRIEAILETTT